MIRTTSFETFRALAGHGTLVPVVRELAADVLTPVAAFAAIHRPPFGFLLESLVGGERWARYTFLGTEPREAWRYASGQAERWTPDAGWTDAGPAPNPLHHLAAQIRPWQGGPLPNLPRFTGGAVGYLSYDVVGAVERLPPPPPDDLGLPDAVFLIADVVVIVDNAFGRAVVVANTRVPSGADRAALRATFDDAQARIDAVIARLRDAPALPPLVLEDDRRLETTSPYERAAFERDVAVLQEHIRAGDIFQAVLSRRQDVPCTAPSFEVYRALRALNPAPYLYYLALDELAIAGSSPEVLVRVEDRDLTVRPIAGTRSRGATPEDDDALAKALLADPKELAEHLMLVDLGRNDVGRVAEYGSVRVTADKVIERYSHVQHIVSEVRGRLRAGLDAFHALEACFPAGTVSGAPKVRAMELLNELEPTRRGPYAGAVVYVGWGGRTLDSAITIRTAVLHAGRAHVQAGAGIVADSVPAHEFRETEKKADAVLAALALAEAGSRASR